MTEEKSLLVIGCPRAATRYTSKVWNKAGVKVGHEYTGPDGSVTHLFAVDCEEYPYWPWNPPKGKVAHVGERRSDFEFLNTWHQVREPLKSITSMSLVVSKNAWEWFSDHIPIAPKNPNKLYLSMQLWLHWNQKCEDVATWTYRVEDFEQHWPRMCTEVGIPPCELPNVSPTTNRSKRWSKPFVDREKIKAMSDTNWAALDQQDVILADSIRQLAEHYGYSTGD